MLALYPSNKLEHLSFLLTTLLRQQPLGVFTPETILVESPGMQHWVSMQLATEHGVAMNIDYPLPVRFMWNTARAVLGQDTVPKQSPYRREVLTWRIDNILQDGSLMSGDAFEQVNRYWQNAGSEQEQGLQRLQLATALADVYEQYLLYRPDWLFKWEANERAVFDDMEIWQSEIWRILAKEQPLHPARLHQMTLEALDGGHIPNQHPTSNLPKRVIVFAINTMAPQLIAFFDALAQHIDIHIFHLNPSVNYWGEAKSSSEQAKLLRLEGLKKWMEEDQSNPLLGNLGKQGRELFNLLTELDTFEISAFDSPDFDEGDNNGENNRSRGLLEYIHNDILRAAPPKPLDCGLKSGDVNASALKEKDDSVTIMCTHSALREVQVLHDHLLHWLSQDKTRTPSDILVMCPAIENYAPFVDAVFHRVGTKSLAGTGQVRLPCTIADRSPMDAEPLIAAFMALLQLPDSRFGVSDIMDYLQLDSVQKRFAVSQDDIEQMVVWLKQAHIHWGLNSAHKTAVSEGVDLDETYSWWWGIRRLLMGMLAPDSEVIVSDLLTIPDVEGQSALTLGKLIDVVALLGEFAQALTAPRTPLQWSKALIALRDACFMPIKEQQQSWDLIAKVAADLAARCEEAGYEHELSLRQVRDLLLNRFSSPDAGNHFMTGQVTVCSMLPMRSIPFKKVCILGLNDSEFPRKSSPLGLDLMASSGRQIGDRSRRLEDRYLFLEAIISTRESLYLSYQGNDVTNNSERQPSLVLAEFMDMLENSYELDLSKYSVNAPLHPFSEAGFTGQIPSYETGWLRLADALQQAKLHSDKVEDEFVDEGNTAVLAPSADTLSSQTLRLSSIQIARAFKDPLEYFSIQRLGVNLSQSFTLLENSEPFETNALLRYQVLDAIFSSPERIAPEKDDVTQLSYSEKVITFASLRGDIPNNPVARDEVDMWKEGALALSQAMGPHDAEPKKAHFQGKYITFTSSALLGSEALVELCAGKVDAHRALSFFISQLVFSSSDEETSYSNYPLDIYSCAWEKGETILKKQRFPAYDRETAVRLLLFIEQLYMAVYTAPTPVYLSLFGTFMPGTRNSDTKAVVESVKPEMFTDILRALLDSADGTNETDKAILRQVQQAVDELCPFIDKEDDVASETTSEKHEKAKRTLDQAVALFDSIELQRALTDWQQSNGQFSADMANNPYLNWLFPQGVSWNDVPHLSAFVLLAMVNNASQEEKL
ncbi:exodeoxyribonuclease V subunit gamma [Alteromonas macleodii str. 'Black Sea 11']|uniref:exodeoxyribonuclease V subunit gamma n=1 Tax=Alteromonas abrolhosensis TaxID=1892904 RepID=UPI000286E93F|nr:exodeoxyribonuclease V subunit gamma [Alteromonas abrolhosensis]AFT78738.1 exodeoxyribonuclease V subunit gamma [Alteromonas macleodii str. 'Black Sea 11']NKW88722.1 exodeoxyribonuclease V subunit gamma [Alteromonadaceae bacterium A_SAG4]NKX04703.1 exodeoxyribonuclease V subunit gamma [Alteromonadaceae bacterium A_SAG6]NKX18246.1 exodeoxyribonuclease V subunit gamma [Alteromonadaceae bacterium A_SAG5]NKX33984.1 exodeoxyribonuclease V subunit gamma [Alteromonadaceae bacterium A_SAG3]